MTESFTVDLPLPPKSLSPNARVHWGVRAKATKIYREACYVLFSIAKPKDWKAGQVWIDMRYQAFRGCGGYHAKDQANAQSSTKALIDGMQDAGVMPSDSHKWLRWRKFELVSRERECKGVHGVFVTVTRI